MNSQKSKDWSDLVKNYAQILAIIVAGWWTYTTFIKKDAPGLESRGNATSELNWYRTADTEDWEVDFGVLMENKGTTSFNISKVRVRGWEFDYGNASKHIDFFDPNKIQSTPTFSDETYALHSGATVPFPFHFPPGAVAGNSFVWLLKDRNCKKRVYFLAEFYKEGDKEPNWSTYQWGQECAAETKLAVEPKPAAKKPQDDQQE